MHYIELVTEQNAQEKKGTTCLTIFSVAPIYNVLPEFNYIYIYLNDLLHCVPSQGGIICP